MKRWQTDMASAYIIGVLCLAMCVVVSAEVKVKGNAPAAVYSFWTMSKQPGAITLLALGSDTPKTLEISPTTLIDGVCEDCILPMKFKAADANKSCAVCGCNVSNAQCIAGKPVKPTWEAMFQGMPRGETLRLFFSVADNPDSGLKTVYIDRTSVFLPVEGLSGHTPEQILALVKQIGGSKAELVDEGKRLRFTVKEGWTHETLAKFEKILAKVGAKLSRPEQVTTK